MALEIVPPNRPQFVGRTYVTSGTLAPGHRYYDGSLVAFGGDGTVRPFVRGDDVGIFAGCVRIDGADENKTAPIDVPEDALVPPRVSLVSGLAWVQAPDDVADVVGRTVTHTGGGTWSSFAPGEFFVVLDKQDGRILVDLRGRGLGVIRTINSRKSALIWTGIPLANDLALAIVADDDNVVLDPGGRVVRVNDPIGSAHKFAGLWPNRIGPIYRPRGKLPAAFEFRPAVPLDSAGLLRVDIRSGQFMRNNDEFSLLILWRSIPEFDRMRPLIGWSDMVNYTGPIYDYYYGPLIRYYPYIDTTNSNGSMYYDPARLTQTTYIKKTNANYATLMRRDGPQRYAAEQWQGVAESSTALYSFSITDRAGTLNIGAASSPLTPGGGGASTFDLYALFIWQKFLSQSEVESVRDFCEARWPTDA